MNSDYEVDFLAVGDGEKSGDAIAFRIGNLTGPREQQFVVAVDGGTKESGQKLVDLIRTRYGTERVDLAISTHPDGDHASGLCEVLEQLKVNTLWMHLPWDHSPDIKHMFTDGRITDTSLRGNLRASLEHANELEKLAKRKDIEILEPFAGEASMEWPTLGLYIRVLGPTRDFYDELLPHFRDCREVKTAAFGAVGVLTAAYAAVKETVKKVMESWGWETLTDPSEEDETSAENNTSVILLIQVGDDKVLLTADAGVQALTHAADFAGDIGIDLTSAKKIQIPHHGSRRNVGPTILNRILGPRLSSSTDANVDTKSAFVSAAIDGSPKHPAKKVLNAFKRRGARCVSTAGRDIWWHSTGAPTRGDYGPINPHPFYSEVDE
jgi:beta-lactamase superfamily II metal-dependent hydrolase